MTSNRQSSVTFNPKALLATVFWIGAIALLSVGNASGKLPPLAMILVTPFGVMLLLGAAALSLRIFVRAAPVLIGMLVTILIFGAGLTLLRLLWKLIVFAWS